TPPATRWTVPCARVRATVATMRARAARTGRGTTSGWRCRRPRRPRRRRSSRTSASATCSTTLASPPTMRGSPTTIWSTPRTLAEMQQLFEANDLTASPIYDIADITKDPHVIARGILLDAPDPELGAVRMVAPTPRLSDTPAAVAWTGPALGAHNQLVYGALGLSATEIDALGREGVI